MARKRPPYRTIYVTATGRIVLSKRMSDTQLSDYLSANSEHSSLNGICPDINNYQVSANTIIPKTETLDWTSWMRDRRNKELTASDWTQGDDSPLNDTKKAEWATYRQALRDLPDLYSEPLADRSAVLWPAKPS